MSATTAPPVPRPLHPLHAILLAFPLPFFLGALVSDLAYRGTFQIQWANFSSWLIAGGLFFGGFALLWALVDLLRSDRAQRGRAAAYFVALLLMWVVGFVNALVHSKDAFAIMPEALYLSALAAALALAAAWLGYSGAAPGRPHGAARMPALLVLGVATALAACDGETPPPRAARTRLPEPGAACCGDDDSRPAAWGTEPPTVPAGYRIDAIATTCEFPARR